MEIKNMQTNDEGKLIEKLEDLLEKARDGKVAKCSIRAAIIGEDDHKTTGFDEALKMMKSMFGDDDDDDDDEKECDCEECECEDTPEETFEDLRKAIGCMTYYGIPLPPAIVTKYNDAYWEKEKDADGEDS